MNRARAIAAGGAIALAASACNLIVGIGEHHLRDDATSNDGGTSTDAATFQDATNVDASSDDASPLPDSAIDAGGIVLANDQQNPSWLLIDTTSVYWVNEADGISPGAVMRVDRDGGTPTVVAPDRARPVEIRYDPTLPYLYFTDDFVSPDGGTYGLFRVPRGGGSIFTLDADGTGYGYGSLGNGSSLCSAAAAPNGQGARVRCSNKNGPPQTPCYPYSTTSPGATIPSVDADNQFVYAIDSAAGTIVRSNINDCTGASVTVFASAPGARRLSFNTSTYMMWVTATEVWRLERANPGGTPFLVASGFNSLTALWPTPTGGVVVTDEGAGAVLRVKYPSVTTVASGQNGPRAVVVDSDDVVYWTNRAGGQVMRSYP